MGASILSPAQQKAYGTLVANTEIANLAVLWGAPGSGKTTVLRQYHEMAGGALLTTRDFVEALDKAPHPLAIEETFYVLLRSALAAHPTVIVDDLHLVSDVVCGCGGMPGYPRPGLLNGPLTALAVLAESSGKRLILGCGGNVPEPIRQRAFTSSIGSFEMADYSHLCRQFLDGAQASDGAASLDFAKIHRFAPHLNAHQLNAACTYLKHVGDLDTERFIEYLRTQWMSSNVELGEVQVVDLHDLQGVDDVIESLEANLIVPLENDELAAELSIKPKRGVLLAGPPGTGKTTIGRALAHRLKSKFFLIDGTFISGTHHFYANVHHIFEAAKQNAPSIIFIDDSDVIFESGQELGLYRYLLTMLDGLESESAGRVCVMMTAMNVGNLPPALLRSGRIELWLETRLPDVAARAAILFRLVDRLPAAFAGTDVTRLSEATEGLTGADLKGVIEDGKLLLAYDRTRGVPLQEMTAYFLKAIETVRGNKERYAEAEAYARAQQKQRPAYFDAFGSMMAAAGSFMVEEAG
jgi:transitional endoplasmic reticulum ATPase